LLATALPVSGSSERDIPFVCATTILIDLHDITFEPAILIEMTKQT
jgi:hypothetical protein